MMTCQALKIANFPISELRITQTKMSLQGNRKAYRSIRVICSSYFLSNIEQHLSSDDVFHCCVVASAIQSLQLSQKPMLFVPNLNSRIIYADCINILVSICEQNCNTSRY